MGKNEFKPSHKKGYWFFFQTFHHPKRHHLLGLLLKYRILLEKLYPSFRLKIVNQQRREMHDIQDIMFAMEEEWNELENEAKQDFQSLRDEIKNKVMYYIIK